MHEQADSMMFNIQINSDEAELTEDPQFNDFQSSQLNKQFSVSYHNDQQIESPKESVKEYNPNIC